MSFLQQLKDYCDSVECVVDYFLQIGILKQQIYQNLPIKPEIISQFPPFAKSKIQLPNSIEAVTPNQFCCPWGLQIPNSQIPAKGSVYSIILTDQQGQKLYCTCLKIYQPLKLQEEKQKNKTQQQFFIDILNQNKVQSRDTLDINTYAQQHFSQNIHFIRNTWCVRELCQDQGNFSFFNPKGKLIPKVLVLVSKVPFFNTFKKVLKGLFALLDSWLEYPIESYIAQSILSVPLPTQGHVQILYSLSNSKIKFSIPPSNELPLLDLELGNIFYWLNLDNVLTVFNHLSLEISVIFFSKEQKKLLTASYSFLSLLFPFHWNLIYVPLIPISLINDLIESPVNFVFGVHSSFKDDFLNRYTGQICMVDLDQNQVIEIKRPLNKKGVVIYKNIHPLHYHYGYKLVNRLKKTIRKLGVRSKPLKLNKKKLDQFSTKTIRNFFFQYYIGILQNYKDYIDFQAQDQFECFRNQEFISSFSYKSRDYIRELSNTQMFANFIQNRVRPQSIDQHTENLFLDQTILEKQNRKKWYWQTKHNLPFLKDISQNHHMSYHVSSMNQQKPDKRFIYHSFPNFSFQQLEKIGIPYKKPPVFSQQIKLPTANFQVVTSQCRTNRSCIFMCWFQIWAASLWYQRPEELGLRLSQVLTVLEKVQEIPAQILTSIYKLLLRTTTQICPWLSLPIFTKMNQCKILMDAAIIQLLQKVISKQKDRNLIMRFTGVSLELTGGSFLQPNCPIQVYKRLYLASNKVNSQNILFQIQEECYGCGVTMEAQDIEQGWRGISNDYQTECPRCKIGIVPHMKVLVEKSDLKDTDFTEENTLFVSPQVLKTLVAQLLLEEQNKLYLNIDLFHMSNSLIFWNLVWHFQNAKLPLEFMFPYESRSLQGSEATRPSLEEVQQQVLDLSGKGNNVKLNILESLISRE